MSRLKNDDFRLNRDDFLLKNDDFHVKKQGTGGRADGVIEDTARISASDVSNVIIWGNHSATQFPDLSHAVVPTPGNTYVIKTINLPLFWVYF